MKEKTYTRAGSIICLVLSALLIFALAACGNDTSKSTNAIKPLSQTDLNAYASDLYDVKTFLTDYYGEDALDRVYMQEIYMNHNSFIVLASYLTDNIEDNEYHIFEYDTCDWYESGCESYHRFDGIDILSNADGEDAVVQMDCANYGFTFHFPGGNGYNPVLYERSEALAKINTEGFITELEYDNDYFSSMDISISYNSDGTVAEISDGWYDNTYQYERDKDEKLTKIIIPERDETIEVFYNEDGTREKTVYDYMGDSFVEYQFTHYDLAGRVTDITEHYYGGTSESEYSYTYYYSANKTRYMSSWNNSSYPAAYYYDYDSNGNILFVRGSDDSVHFVYTYREDGSIASIGSTLTREAVRLIEETQYDIQGRPTYSEYRIYLKTSDGEVREDQHFWVTYTKYDDEARVATGNSQGQGAMVGYYDEHEYLPSPNRYITLPILAPEPEYIK